MFESYNLALKSTNPVLKMRTKTVDYKYLILFIHLERPGTERTDFLLIINDGQIEGSYYLLQPKLSFYTSRDSNNRLFRKISTFF